MDLQCTKCERVTWKRVVPRDDPFLKEHYPWMLDHAPEHDIVEMKDGIYRWKPNELQRHLADVCCLNDLCTAYHEGKFTTEQYQKFNRDMGYSLSGYDEIWGDILWPQEEEEEEEDEDE